MARGIGDKEGQYNQNDIVEAYTAHFFDISNEKTARKLFRYISQYTDNEWSFLGDDKGCHLSTSNMSWTDVYGGIEATQSGESGKLSFFFHSHPRNEANGMYVNDTDQAMRNKCLEKSPNAVIGVMHRGTLYDFQTFKIRWDGTKL